MTASLAVTYIAAVTSPLYNRDILRLAASIPHLGRLPDPQARVERSSPTCGSWVAVDVQLDGEGRVVALAQEVRACALGQAAAALMGRHAIGRTPAELRQAHRTLADYLAERRDDAGGWPGVELLAPARPFSARHASVLLAFDAAAEAAAQARAGTPVAG